MKPFELETIFLKFKNESLTPKERVWLDEMKLSPEFEHAWQELENTWQAYSEFETPSSASIGEQWFKLNTRILNEDRVRQQKQFSKNWRFGFARLHAFVGLALAILLLWIGFEFFSPAANINQFQTQAGEMKTIALADGSSIEMNAVSQIQLNENFNATSRDIQLVGEAYFEVAKSKVPFIITTDHAKIQVVGTKFNVNSFNANTVVDVEIGLVKLFNLKNTDSLMLNKFESAIIEKGELKRIERSNRSSAFAWRLGELIFEKTNLSEVCQTLSRKFAIAVSSDSSASNILISGHFKNESLPEICDFISQATGFQIEKKKGEIRFVK